MVSKVIQDDKLGWKKEESQKRKFLMHMEESAGEMEDGLNFELFHWD